MVPLRQETVTLKNASPGYLPRLKDNSNYGGVGSISTTVDYVNVPRTWPSFLRSFSPGWLPFASLAARPRDCRLPLLPPVCALALGVRSAARRSLTKLHPGYRQETE